MSLLVSLVAVEDGPDGSRDLDSVDGDSITLGFDIETGQLLVHNGLAEYDVGEWLVMSTSYPVHLEVRVLNTGGNN